MARWIMTVLLQLDELANAILGGYAHETISARFAHNANDGGAPGCLFCAFIHIVLPDHCDLAGSMAAELARPADCDDVRI